MTIAPALADVVLAGVLLGTAAMAAPPHAPIANTPGNVFSYQIRFDGSFWNGQRINFSRTSTITIGPDNAVRVVSAGSAAGDAGELDGTIAPDGSIQAQNAGNRIESYNIVASLLRGAPSALTQGASWSALVPIQTGATGQVGYLPVTIHVISNAADGAILQGTGAQSLTASYDGYTAPIDVAARFALRLTASGFDRCDFSGSELVHAGPQTQTMHWQWSMTRLAPARS
jgi:hypothetical protein